MGERYREHLVNAIARSSRDWSADHRDAWIYGIIVGWNREAMAELCTKYNWNSAVLRQLHDDFWAGQEGEES